jgi:hypothetical protein
LGHCRALQGLHAKSDIYFPGEGVLFTAILAIDNQEQFQSLEQSPLEFLGLSLHQFVPCGGFYILLSLSKPPAASKLSPYNFRLLFCRLFDALPNLGFFCYLSSIQFPLFVFSWYCSNTTACIYSNTTA